MSASSTATPTEVARRYFDAISAHDLDAAVACWVPGSIDNFVGQQQLIAPDGVRAYFAELFSAFPDFAFEILSTTEAEDRCAVRWRARATFAGPGRFQNFAPNGATIEIEGCDVVTVGDQGLITRNDAYLDSGDVVRQLGFLPPAGSKAEQRLTKLANAKTRALHALHGAEPEAIAPGVYLVRGGRPRNMNVYLLEDEGGLTVFDAGISDMTEALRSAAARMGGIKRVVLGHADADHRGAAPGLGAPVFCHQLERQAAESANPYRDYWEIAKLAPWARPLYPRMLSMWDGGATPIEGTVAEGDEIAGFRVIELPGHAPGLIGLFREEDRLALVSDCFYTIDPETGLRREAGVPHPAFNQDTEIARASIRKLAELNPCIAWAGHANPVSGGDIEAQLLRAAGA
jgi:hydroxyacylglutathione hydrolase